MKNGNPPTIKLEWIPKISSKGAGKANQTDWWPSCGEMSASPLINPYSWRYFDIWMWYPTMSEPSWWGILMRKNENTDKSDIIRKFSLRVITRIWISCFVNKKSI
jgi:hypothetical protein